MHEHKISSLDIVPVARGVRAVETLHMAGRANSDLMSTHNPPDSCG